MLERLDAILMTHERRDPHPRRPGGSADLFHAVPLGIIDPFLYFELDGRRVAVISVLERDRIQALEPRASRCIDPIALGLDELLRAGVAHEADVEVACAPASELGVGAAPVPPDFPVAAADQLREHGVELASTSSASTGAGAPRPRASSTASAAPRRPPTRRWPRPRG